jgi:prepilin-type N-terminal cleavage/methylation domain-containing protein
MKKNRINAFTLVEMLIVIVIIGILIAALMPRMQAAQWRARDVARKTALSQVQSAIVTSQGDKWERPWQKTKGATGWIGLSVIADELKTAWMNSVPQDPLKSSVSGIGDKTITWGDYVYIVTRRNWTNNWWFALMAKTEVEWGSNWVVCSGWAGQITGGTDIARITLCDKIVQSGSASANKCANNYSWTCIYSLDSELRYLVVY